MDVHEFQVEILRREVHRCSDLELMRELTLSMLELMDRQREFVVEHYRPV